jgi:ribosome-associated protein
MSQIREQDSNTIHAEIDDEVLAVARAASEKKALDLIVLDLRPVASFTDYFIICGGSNSRQVQAIADGVEDSLREMGRRKLHIEGYSAAEWILLDYGDFIVHVFGAQARKFYDLERLWRDAVRVKLPDELVE